MRSYLAINGFVPSVMLVILCYGVLLAARLAPWGLALLALPGTFAHEAAHFFVGLICGAKPYGMSLWPRRSGGSWRLGEVRLRRVGVINGAPIALAPLCLLPLSWLCLMHLVVPAWPTRQWLFWLSGGYLAATLLYAAVPSVTDLRVGGRSLFVYSVVGGLFWLVLPLLRSWYK